VQSQNSATLAPEQAAGNESTSDFDWAHDDSIICRSQRATACYFNNDNDVVIRQERGWDDDDDPYLLLTQENAIALMLRIKALLEYQQARPAIDWQKAGQDFDAFEGRAPKDRTGAVRQRRYRERHNGKGDGADRDVTLDERQLSLVAAE
jgi:hypothetical protein